MNSNLRLSEIGNGSFDGFDSSVTRNRTKLNKAGAIRKERGRTLNQLLQSTSVLWRVSRTDTPGQRAGIGDKGVGLRLHSAFSVSCKHSERDKGINRDKEETEEQHTQAPVKKELRKGNKWKENRHTRNSI